MAEETPGVANKKLLVVALVLAVVMVVFYNIQVAAIRSSSRGQTEWVLQFQVDRSSGEKISSGDIKAVEIETRFAKGLGSYLTQKDRDFALGRVLNQSVTRGQWLLWSHVTASEENNPSRNIRPNMVKYSFTIDPGQSPTETLREGDRVNVWGMFILADKIEQAYPVIENLKVMEVPSRNKITVEVTQKIAGQLANVRTNAIGSLWFTVRNPTEPGKSPQVNPKLSKLSAVPLHRRGLRFPR